MWSASATGPDEAFTLTASVVAEQGDTAVVRVEVEYARAREYRDLWVVAFDANGLCVDFEEWPYFPGQSITAPRD